MPEADYEKRPEDEFGQVEADLPPEGTVPEDEYIEDPDYDESLAAVDPETRGHE